MQKHKQRNIDWIAGQKYLHIISSEINGSELLYLQDKEVYMNHKNPCGRLWPATVSLLLLSRGLFWADPAADQVLVWRV